MKSASLSAARKVAGELVDAHGGFGRWLRAEALEVHLSSWGLAFATKGQPDALRDVKAWISTSGQRLALAGTKPHAWSYAAPDGLTLSAALRRLRTGRRRFRWEIEDIAAFAASALWTYFHIPYVLTLPDVEVELLAPSRFASSYQRLGVLFPDHLATHSPVQVLHFDDNRIIRRHDYTALAFGRWARACHRLEDHRTFEGLLVPTRRRVTPRLPGGAPAPGPALVNIEIQDVRIVPLVWSVGGAGHRAGLPPSRCPQ